MGLPEIEIGRGALANLESGLGLEWLVTDGTGSYASSTVTGCNTRRYHGLLVAARRPPGDRAVLLSRVEEVLEVGGVSAELATSEYPGTIHPRGWQRLVRFRLAPFPESTFAVGGALLVREVFLLRGRRMAAVRYRLEGPFERAELAVRPLVACRGFHHLSPPDAPFRTEPAPGGVRVVAPWTGNSLILGAPGGRFEPAPLRFHRNRYRQEEARGLDFEEELYSPGVFRLALERSRPVAFLACAGPVLEDLDIEAERERELARRRELVQSAPGLDPSLVLAADDFLVRDGERGWVIAGYPWFDAWGRDTFLSLEGLTLATGRFEDARAVLDGYTERIAGGLVPNFLAPDPPADAFNSIDAGLWYVHAVGRYLEITGDADPVARRYAPAVRRIVEAYRAGTRFGIGVGPDGLLAGGAPDTQLTWMDAHAGGRPATPRHGRAVEVNALWYAALRVAQDLARRFGGPAAEYGRWASEAAESFEPAFRLPSAGHLADCVAGSAVDASLRPNQLLALSLPHPVLSRDRWPGILEAVERRLLTPWGLRTLEPGASGYRGRHEGGVEARDAAYHQGTVWPWLLGPYLGAVLAHGAGSAASRRAVEAALSVFRSHLAEGCLGQVGETFDGDPPHAPRGAFAQAWSVAELLRIHRVLAMADRIPVA